MAGPGVVATANRAYLSERQGMAAMEPMASHNASGEPRFASRPAIIAMAAAAGLLLAVTLALWAHYGTAVFYEMILAGIAACF